MLKMMAGISVLGFTIFSISSGSVYAGQTLLDHVAGNLGLTAGQFQIQATGLWADRRNSPLCRALMAESSSVRIVHGKVAPKQTGIDAQSFMERLRKRSRSGDPRNTGYPRDDFNDFLVAIPFAPEFAWEVPRVFQGWWQQKGGQFTTTLVLNSSITLLLSVEAMEISKPGDRSQSQPKLPLARFDFDLSVGVHPIAQMIEQSLSTYPFSA